jgi:hypothetical protein
MGNLKMEGPAVRGGSKGAIPGINSSHILNSLGMRLRVLTSI